MTLLGSTLYENEACSETLRVFVLKTPKTAGRNKNRTGKGQKHTELEASGCKDMSLFLPLFRGFWNKDTSTHKSFILISFLGAKATFV